MSWEVAFKKGICKDIDEMKLKFISRVEAKKPALLSSRDGYLLELTGWTKGSQAS